MFLDSIGVIFGFLSNQQISEGIMEFKARVEAASDDSVSYITDTVDVSQTAHAPEHVKVSCVRYIISDWVYTPLMHTHTQEVMFISTDQFDVVADIITCNVDSKLILLHTNTIWITVWL